MSRAASFDPMRSPAILEQPTGEWVGHGLEAAANFGPLPTHGAAAVGGVTEYDPGRPSRYIDPATQLLGFLAATWQDFQQLRKSMTQRELPESIIAVQATAEKKVASELAKALRKHPLWPWLSQYPGLGGVHTARLISRIGDPRRFPGQQCSIGHTMTPDYAPGTPCPMDDWEGNACPGTMRPPRPHTGTRSVWHYLGLHVVDGRSPRKAKGQRVDWDPIGRTAVLQPDGIADHIVRHRTPKYRDLYDATKERLTRERAACALESVVAVDPLPIDTAEAEDSLATDAVAGLRPFQIDAIARKVAAKAFVADLLAEWKRVAAALITEEAA